MEELIRVSQYYVSHQFAQLRRKVTGLATLTKQRPRLGIPEDEGERLGG